MLTAAEETSKGDGEEEEESAEEAAEGKQKARKGKSSSKKRSKKRGSSGQKEEDSPTPVEYDPTEVDLHALAEALSSVFVRDFTKLPTGVVFNRVFVDINGLENLSFNIEGAQTQFPQSMCCSIICSHSVLVCVVM